MASGLWGKGWVVLLHNGAPAGEEEEKDVTALEPRRRKPRHTPLFLHLMSRCLPLSWGPHPARPQLGSGTNPCSDQGVADSLALRWAGTPGDF